MFLDAADLGHDYAQIMVATMYITPIRDKII